MAFVSTRFKTHLATRGPEVCHQGSTYSAISAVHPELLLNLWLRVHCAGLAETEKRVGFVRTFSAPQKQVEKHSWFRDYFGRGGTIEKNQANKQTNKRKCFLAKKKSRIVNKQHIE